MDFKAQILPQTETTLARLQLASVANSQPAFRLAEPIGQRLRIDRFKRASPIVPMSGCAARKTAQVHHHTEHGDGAETNNQDQRPIAHRVPAGLMTGPASVMRP